MLKIQSLATERESIESSNQGNIISFQYPRKLQNGTDGAFLQSNKATKGT